MERPSRAADFSTSDVASACGGSRWISAGGTCEATMGFDAEPLLPADTQPPDTLAGYCLHTWTGDVAPTELEIAAWQSKLATVDMAEDCVFVTPQASKGGPLATFLRDALVQRIGMVTGPDMSALPAPVHVALIDTTPDASASASVLGNNRHGDTLAALIAEVVQVPGAVSVSTSLALPYSVNLQTGLPEYHASGGDFGYLSDLSRALWRALKSHEADFPAARLVLNLSVGWEPLDAASACAGVLAPGPRAVRDLLDFAACQEGALIVAASGNTMGGPSPASGLVCPAAFMALTPSCQSTRPLVIAAGGVDHGDAPLEIARPASATPFALPAIGADAWPEGALPPAALTGTSVAAAAMSASLAAVWAAKPDLDPAALTDLLYAKARPLERSANQCPPGMSACGVRRISPCDALAVLGGAIACAAGAGGSSSLSGSAGAAVLVELSGRDCVSLSAAPPLLPSQLSPTPGGQGHVFPQPLISSCPNCVVLATSSGNVSNPVLYGLLSAPLSSMVVVVREPGGDVSSYAIPISASGAAFQAALPVSRAVSAWLSGTDALTGLSVIEQIPVIH